MLHDGRGHGDANPVQIGDKRGKIHEEENCVTRPRGPRHSPGDHKAPSAARRSNVDSKAATVRATSSSVCAAEVNPPGQEAMSTPCRRNPARILFTNSSGMAPFSAFHGAFPA